MAAYVLYIDCPHCNPNHTDDVPRRTATTRIADLPGGSYQLAPDAQAAVCSRCHKRFEIKLTEVVAAPSATSGN